MFVSCVYVVYVCMCVYMYHHQDTLPDTANPQGKNSLNDSLSSSILSHRLYRIRSIFGGDFNLAVWQFFVCPPNLNDANIAS